MSAWSRKFGSCRNCGTLRYPHGGLGYCQRCYPLVKRRVQAEKWDRSAPETLLGYPREGDEALKEFDSIKCGYVKQLNERLQVLKARERKLAGPVFGINIEYQLRRIAKLAKSRDENLYFGIASSIDDMFQPDQKVFFYGLLNKLEESVPWRGINWNRLFIH